jgi:hypothetical protein
MPTGHGYGPLKIELQRALDGRARRSALPVVVPAKPANRSPRSKCVPAPPRSRAAKALRFRFATASMSPCKSSPIAAKVAEPPVRCDHRQTRPVGSRRQIQFCNMDMRSWAWICLLGNSGAHRQPTAFGTRRAPLLVRLQLVSVCKIGRSARRVGVGQSRPVEGSIHRHAPQFLLEIALQDRHDLALPLRTYHYHDRGLQ